MGLKTKVLAINRLLSEAYGKETTLSQLLLQNGFTADQILCLKNNNLEAVTDFFAECLDLANITERKYTMLVLRYGLKDTPPMTLKQVGDQFGVSRERIRQIMNYCIRRLRHPRTKNAIESAFYIYAYELLESKNEAGTG